MNKPNYSGPNFCPNCGCHIRSVAIALLATQPQDVTPEPELLEPSKPRLSSEEIVRQVKKGRAEGKKLTAICEEIGIPPSSVYYHESKVSKLKMQAALAAATKPRTTPAIVASDKSRPKISPQQREEMHQRRAAGESAKQIAAAMGFKETTVSSIVYRKSKEEKAA